jgi:hypothetical protein
MTTGRVKCTGCARRRASLRKAKNAAIRLAKRKLLLAQRIEPLIAREHKGV